MRKISIITIFILAIKNILAQQGTPTLSLDMYPKSPDAASLSKFSDIPSGNYTGVATFSIPIYSIEVDGNVFPIELKYSTYGIKVSQIASRVGLGWALSIGNVSLSEQVVGLRDFNYRTNLPDGFNPNLPNPTVEDQNIAGEMTDEAGPFQEITPDVYTYSIPNGSGRFIFDSNGKFGIPMPYNQIKISPINDNGGISILDGKGISYKFLKSFAYFNGNTCTTRIGPKNTTMSYFPSIITTQQGKDITFDYNKRLPQNQAVFVNSMTEQKLIDSYTVPFSDPTHVLTPPYCYNYSTSYEELFSEINFPGGKVHFYYNDDINPNIIREDVPNDRYLKKVIVKNNNNLIIKDITFNYSYFTSNDNFDLSPPIPQMIQGINKRLKLTEVIDNLTGGKYELSYYEDHSLPNRLSFSQDWWGVYNGKTNTETSIPTATYSKISSNGEMVKFLQLGADKYPDFNYGVTGNLKKIKYPTGGYTQITYESDIFFSEFPFNKKVYNKSFRKAATSDSTTIATVNFTILENSFPTKITFKGSDDSHLPGGSQINMGKIQIYKLGNPSTLEFSTTISGEYEKKLNTGNYKMQITSGQNQDLNPVDCNGMIEWITETNDPNFNGYETGTIRVQKIEAVDENNQKVTRRYTYLNPETNYTTSSGKNQGQMFFNPIKKYEYPGGVNGRSNTKTVLINNQSIDSQVTDGKPVAYSYVQEIYSSPKEEYKKEYHFFNDDIFEQRNPNSLLYTGWPIKDQRNGLLLSEVIFDKKNNRVKQITNEYNFDDYFNKQSTAYKPTIPHSINGITSIYIKSISCSLICKNEYVWSDEKVPNYWIKNLKAITTDYVNNIPTIVTEQITSYSNPPQHTFPIEQKVQILGDGKSNSKHYQYAIEKGNIYLTSKNIISIPLETEVKNTTNGVTVTVSKTFANYPTSQADANQYTKGLPLPKNIISNDLQGNPSLEVTYDQYDSKGNLQQYTTKDGVSTVIIWGYNSTQPIAKIEDATYFQVQGISTIITSSDIDANQTPGNDESALLSALDSFRTNNSNYQITTYTYDPLIGVRSITPPSGMRELYYYDTAHRLQFIKDINNKILKEYKYNYKQ